MEKWKCNDRLCLIKGCMGGKGKQEPSSQGVMAEYDNHLNFMWCTEAPKTSKVSIK